MWLFINACIIHDHVNREHFNVQDYFKIFDHNPLSLIKITYKPFIKRARGHRTLFWRNGKLNLTTIKVFFYLSIMWIKAAQNLSIFLFYTLVIENIFYRFFVLKTCLMSKLRWMSKSYSYVTWKYIHCM